MSEVMLQNSLSASSLVKQAAAAVQAQQAKGILLDPRRDRAFFGRAVDFGPSSLQSQAVSRDPIDYFSSRSTSGLQTPDHGERKHIRFADKVEQCIAVECKDGDYDDDEDDVGLHDDDSSDDGVVMMKRSRRRRPLPRANSRASSSGETKIIEKLPSTTLKYRTDSPDVPDDPPHHSLGLLRSTGLSPSSSQETLRPGSASTNFLLPDFDEEEDDDEPALTLAAPKSRKAGRDIDTKRSEHQTSGNDQDDGESGSSSGGGLRRTSSGMFMPIEDQAENTSTPGLMGKVVDTVNTARDIAHVIWNVGWRN
jgi:hypothetical protein